MICHFCEAWAPKTWEALRNRQRNVENEPDVQFHKCPHCHGTDWALTSRFIGTLPPLNPPYSTRRLVKSWLFWIGFLIGVLAFVTAYRYMP